MSKILAIDDDLGILKIIKKSLTKDGHDVVCVQDVESEQDEFYKNYDLILLDVMMPKIDGFTFLRRVRDEVDCPVLFLTAKVMEDDVIEGFGCGADDYIKKPFSIVELRARVNAHIRREKRESRNRLLCGNMKFDLQSKQFYIKDEYVKLTRSQYDILEYLALHKGQVFSLEQILEAVLGYDSESDCSAIREHVKNIRNKLGKYGESPIETVWGVGYRWR